MFMVNELSGTSMAFSLVISGLFLIFCVFILFFQTEYLSLPPIKESFRWKMK
jgi:hypothetical protein